MPLWADVQQDSDPRRIEVRRQAYREYLHSIAHYLPQPTRDFVLSDWYYSDTDKCPHDAWLESLEIFERFSGERKERRDIHIRVNSRFVFSWNGGEGGGGKQERNIYIKKIGAGEPVRLTFAPEDERYPAWSPDRRYIAFCRMIDDRPPLKRVAVYVIPAAGGTERRITEAGEGVSWSPDNKTFAVASLPPESGGVFLISLDTGRRSRVADSGPYVARLPAFSPNGQWIVFARSVQRGFISYPRRKGARSSASGALRRGRLLRC
jgi:hypothetical protein